MGTIGKVNKNSKHIYEFEWTISNFFSLSEEDDISYNSPSFSFDGATWYLKVYPNGDKEYDSIGYVDLVLYRKSPGPPYSLEFSLSLKSLEGKKVGEWNEIFIFEEAFKSRGLSCFMSRSEIFEMESELLLSDALTVVCTLKCPKSTADASVDCRLRSSVVLHESKVLQDYKEFFLKTEDCDVILKVKGQEFPAHKTILKARSSVFASTYRYDTKEKATGIIDIEDCEPSFFSDFLCFLYCGDTDVISVENVFSLFTAGDKYDVQDLRAKCVEFMKQNLSIETFCTTITLALQHSETELIKLATDLFAKNAENIIVTAKWQSFLAENPTYSNELFIKALAASKCSNE